MNYLLDTNIVILYSKSRDLARHIEEEHQIFAEENKLSISFVSIAEINSILHQFAFGDRRRKEINDLLARITRLDISYEHILEAYENIDAYSQGRHKSLKSDFSSINMGKNDLWIAATASAFNITLVTSDKDFNHLDGVFLDVEYVDLARFQ